MLIILWLAFKKHYIGIQIKRTYRNLRTYYKLLEFEKDIK